MTQITDLDSFYDRLAEGQFTDTMAGDVRNPYPALAEKRRTTPVEKGQPFGTKAKRFTSTAAFGKTASGAIGVNACPTRVAVGT